METLKIENFLTIRSAEIEVKDFTILIGPQGSGKSVIAKLVYFFREFLRRDFLLSIGSLEENEQDLRITGLNKFFQIFPAYAWNEESFFIEYKNKDVQLSLKRTGPTELYLGYSENLSDIYNDAKLTYGKKMEEAGQEQESDVLAGKNWAFLDGLYKKIYISTYGYIFRSSVFIPASRSFFASLQQNIFSFLAGNISIDPLIKEFGSVYESCKVNYRNWGRKLKSSDFK